MACSVAMLEGGLLPQALACSAALVLPLAIASAAHHLIRYCLTHALDLTVGEGLQT